MTTRRQFMGMMTAAAATAVAIPSLLLSGKGIESAFPHGWTVIVEQSEPLYGELGDKYAQALFASYNHTAEEAFSKVVNKAFQARSEGEPNA